MVGVADGGRGNTLPPRLVAQQLKLIKKSSSAVAIPLLLEATREGLESENGGWGVRISGSDIN
jgi:hypothetical protein